jgi:hypothetical protein
MLRRHKRDTESGLHGIESADLPINLRVNEGNSLCEFQYRSNVDIKQEGR